MHEVTSSSTPQSIRILDATSGLRRGLAGRMLGSLLFTGLIFVGANIRIPLEPVPITLQTLFVLLAGAMLGRGLGTISSAVYILLGVAGLEVFAGHPTGWAVLSGPTGGYLLGFIAAPLLIGRLIRRRSSLAWSVLVFSAGSLLILSLGVLHLTLFYTHDLAVSLEVGALPFLIGDIIKIAAAGSIYKSFLAFRRYHSTS
jgi:biotin transport system substrate-specific component